MIASTKKYDFRQPMFLCTFIPEPLSNSAHISTKYEQALLAPTHFRGQNNSHMSLYTPMPTPTSARDSYRHAHADDASIHSFASAQTPTMIRPPLLKSMLKIDNLHSNKARTTFRSNSNAETHEKNVDREISCFWISKGFNQKETCSMMTSS